MVGWGAAPRGAGSAPGASRVLHFKGGSHRTSVVLEPLVKPSLCPQNPIWAGRHQTWELTPQRARGFPGPPALAGSPSVLTQQRGPSLLSGLVTGREGSACLHPHSPGSAVWAASRADHTDRTHLSWAPGGPSSPQAWQPQLLGWEWGHRLQTSRCWPHPQFSPAQSTSPALSSQHCPFLS